VRAEYKRKIAEWLQTQQKTLITDDLPPCQEKSISMPAELIICEARIISSAGAD
jgi:hypothetical protein